jgi:hypothetical protein
MSKLFKELSLAHATIARLYQEAAGESAAPPAVEDKPKGKPGPKPKAKQAEPSDDPLAGLTGASEPEPEVADEVVEADPLADLMGGAEAEPEVPAVTRESLAKLLGEMAAQVDRVKGKGVGAQALAGMFKKHGSANLKTLAEDEFLAVQNEANAVIGAISKLASA